MARRRLPEAWRSGSPEKLSQPVIELPARAPGPARESLRQAVAEFPGLPGGYPEFLADIKARIAQARVKAGVAANRELVLLYWEVGRQILKRQQREGWGANVVDMLSADLRRAFPEMKGFSPRNLRYMRRFAEAYRKRAFVQQAAAQIPWFHNCLLLEQVVDPVEREWYLRQTVEHGWSRNVLALQIETGLYQRQGKAVSNFRRTLPPPQSDLAEQTLKDPYVFDFLTLDTEAREREIERGLLGHLREFLLELGVGFAFVGQQVHLEVGEEDFYIDLLFYHLRLRCFVVIDLKTKAFTPEDAGKMNFYLSAVDDRLRHADDRPSIGLILCKPKSSNRLIAEYALRDMSKPIGVSQYQLSRALPGDLKSSLPTIEELEAELSRTAGPAGRQAKGRSVKASKGRDPG